MSPDVSERSFEEAIEACLLQRGTEGQAGGYHKRRPEDYDRALCLIPNDVVDFILATQAKEWQALVSSTTAYRSRSSSSSAWLPKSNGAGRSMCCGMESKTPACKFDLAYFRPASRLNEETRRLYQANLCSVVRQLRYSSTHEKSLDLVLFLKTADPDHHGRAEEPNSTVKTWKTRSGSTRARVTRGNRYSPLAAAWRISQNTLNLVVYDDCFEGRRHSLPAV